MLQESTLYHILYQIVDMNNMETTPIDRAIYQSLRLFHRHSPRSSWYSPPLRSLCPQLVQLILRLCLLVSACFHPILVISNARIGVVVPVAPRRHIVSTTLAPCSAHQTCSPYEILKAQRCHTSNVFRTWRILYSCQIGATSLSICGLLVTLVLVLRVLVIEIVDTSGHLLRMRTHGW